jgi:hypothetical protein
MPDEGAHARQRPGMGIHPSINWEVADAAARAAISGLDDSHVYRELIQQDDFSRWMVTSQTDGVPTWMMQHPGSGVWPADLGGTGNDLSGADDGSMFYFDTDRLLATDPADLVWDNANKFLGIGTASPISPFDVRTSVSAVSGLGRGINFVQTIAATANDDELVGVFLEPTFDDGIYSEINHQSIWIYSGLVRIGSGVPSVGAPNLNPKAVLIAAPGPADMFWVMNTEASGPGTGAHVCLYSDDGAALVSGDRMGGFLFGGFDGVSTGNGAGVLGFCDGDWSSTSHPSRFEFQVCAAGSITRAAVLTIKTDQVLSAQDVLLASGKVLKIDSVQVLGAQQSYLGASLKEDYTTGDLDTEAELITALNAIAGKVNDMQGGVQTHGLFAPS